MQCIIVDNDFLKECWPMRSSVQQLCSLFFQAIGGHFALCVHEYLVAWHNCYPPPITSPMNFENKLLSAICSRYPRPLFLDHELIRQLKWTNVISQMRLQRVNVVVLNHRLQQMRVSKLVAFH